MWWVLFLRLRAVVLSTPFGVVLLYPALDLREAIANVRAKLPARLVKLIHTTSRAGSSCILTCNDDCVSVVMRVSLCCMLTRASIACSSSVNVRGTKAAQRPGHEPRRHVDRYEYGPMLTFKNATILLDA